MMSGITLENVPENKMGDVLVVHETPNNSTTLNNSIQSEKLSNVNFSINSNPIPYNPINSLKPASFNAPQTMIYQLIEKQTSMVDTQQKALAQLIDKHTKLTGVDPRKFITVLTNIAPKPNPQKQTLNKITENLQIKTKLDKKKEENGDGDDISNEEQELEEKLSNIIDDNGGVSELEKVPQLIKLMTSETNIKLQSLLITVILSSQRVPIRKKFIESGLLEVISQWFTQPQKTKNFLKQLFKVLEFLQNQITVEALKSCTIGKVVKSLGSKATDKEISDIANQFVNSWMKLITAVAEKKEAIPKKRPMELIEEKPKPGESPINFKKKLKLEKEEEKKSTEQKQTLRTSGEPKQEKKDEEEEKKKVSLAESDDFDAKLSLASAKKKALLGPDHLKRKRPTTHLIDVNTTNQQTVTRSSSYQPRPLSADDIRKEKFKQKVIKGEVSDAGGTSVTPPVKTLHLGLAKPILKTEAMSIEVDQSDTVIDEPVKQESIVPAILMKKVKKVIWRDQKLGAGPLVERRLFKKDPGSVMSEDFKATRDFMRAIKMEHANEREKLLQKKKEEDDVKRHMAEMKATVSWRRPTKLLQDSELIINRGEDSEEVKTQIDRESKILNLSSLLFLKDKEKSIDTSKIPENPSEPANVEPNDTGSQMKLIPFDEVIEENVNQNNQPYSASNLITPSVNYTNSNNMSFSGFNPFMSNLSNNVPPTIPHSIPVTPAPTPLALLNAINLNLSGINLQSLTPVQLTQLLSLVNNQGNASPQIKALLNSLTSPSQPQSQPNNFNTNTFNSHSSTQNFYHGSVPGTNNMTQNNNISQNNLGSNNLSSNISHNTGPSTYGFKPAQNFQNNISNDFRQDNNNGPVNNFNNFYNDNNRNNPPKPFSSMNNNIGEDSNRNREPPSNPNNKRQLCTYYNSKGGCKYGDACTFIHADKDLILPKGDNRNKSIKGDGAGRGNKKAKW